MQIDVDAAGRLLVRIIRELVNRESRNGFVVQEYRGRTVAVVHVAVYDHRALDEAVDLQPADRHGDVVDRAEAFAMAWEGMVKAAAVVVAETVFQGAAAGQDRAAGGEPNGVHHFSGVRNFELNDFLVAESALAQRRHPVTGVDPQHVIVGSGVRGDEIGGIGDATCDIAPLQVGQFESGNEVEDDLSRLYLEGGGGGQKTESYELALYFLARKTAIDCWEKRRAKGYAFLIGDEMPYGRVKRREVEHVFGDTLKADIPIADIVAEVQEKYELFYILPNLTSYYDNPQILLTWQKLLGQNALRLPDPAAISESIAATIGLAEGSATFDRLAADLVDAGTSPSVMNAVSAALAHVGNAAAAAFGWSDPDGR